MAATGEKSSDNESASTQKKEAKGTEKSPSPLTKLWNSCGLSVTLLKAMFKGACPPTIAVALYQYDAFALNFPTLGYLVAIMSVLSMCILPRAKFFQTMVFNVLGVCIGSCIALLTCYCSVQARIQTSQPVSSANTGASGSTQAVEYNSSASAVCGIWLFFNIMFANALRFSRPQLQTPVIMYSIFANVSGTFAPLFATMSQSIAFVKQLMEAFFAGFAIATVVHLVVFPRSSRDVVREGFIGYFAALKGTINAQQKYLQSMEHGDMLEHSITGKGETLSDVEKASKNLKAALAALGGHHAKVYADLPFAKREIAFGHLDAKDTKELFGLLRSIYLPILGLGSVVDIFERLADKRGWNKPCAQTVDTNSTQEDHHSERQEEISEWNEIMQTLHHPFESVSHAMLQGLDHSAYAFRLAKKPKDRGGKREVDPENDAGLMKPGDSKFKEHLCQKDKEFWESRASALRVWCVQKGVTFPDDPETKATMTDADLKLMKVTTQETGRQQLYLILYMEYLLHAASQGVLELVKFADKKTEEGVMNRRRLLLPGKRRLKKWIRSAFSVEDSSNDHAPDSAESEVYSVTLGDAFQQQKDPEHLPPTNNWQRLGNGVRKVSHFLKSNEMAFGFRVACATMSIAVVAFLQRTQAFFVAQRLVWAMIMVAIGMTMTSGSGVFGLVGRVTGTLCATIMSMVIWYIAGGRGIPGAVIPLLFLVLAALYYCFIKYPRFLPTIIVTQVTMCLIVGYELQVDKIGIAKATASGQAYYPIYELAPYRLATVAGGCAVAAVWTFFPYPLTARSILRRQLGESIYILGNYYSVVHFTLRMRLDSTGGDINDKQSPAARLDKVRINLHSKMVAFLTQLQGHLSFVPWEFSFGGKFPLQEYRDLIKDVQNLFNYMALVSYSTRDYAHNQDDSAASAWLNDLSKITNSIKPASHEITKLLVMLSSSLIDGKPLPPYLQTPPNYGLSNKLQEMDPQILSAKHFLEPGYASFAVTQVASKLINDDLCNVLKRVKRLVGVVDFSFHVVSVANDSDSTLVHEESGKGKQD